MARQHVMREIIPHSFLHQMNRIKSIYRSFLRFYGWLGYDYSLNRRQPVLRFLLNIFIPVVVLVILFSTRIPLLTDELGPLNDFFKLSAYCITYISFMFEAWQNCSHFHSFWINFEQLYVRISRLTEERLLRQEFINFHKTYLLLFILTVPLSFIMNLVYILFAQMDGHFTELVIIELAFIKIFIRIRHYHIVLYVQMITILSKELEIQIEICTNNRNYQTRLHTIKEIHLKLFFLSDQFQTIFNKSLLLLVAVWHFDMLANSYWFIHSINLYGQKYTILQLLPLVFNTLSLALMIKYCEKLRKVRRSTAARIDGQKVQLWNSENYLHQLSISCINQFRALDSKLLAMGCVEVSYNPIASIIVSVCTYLAFFIEIGSRSMR
uniref:gustatory receptor 66 n=1 Tax=Aedes aegypti TaxID=7159 RepID=UPI000C1DC713|nr:gustatory receptor 66 [Aedes aegypti]